MEAPPLYLDTLALASGLLEELEGVDAYPELRRRVLVGVLALVDEVSLVFAGLDRGGHLLAADAELQTLRNQVDLALDLGLLTEEAFLLFLEQADEVGRQIGGWRRQEEAYAH